MSPAALNNSKVFVVVFLTVNTVLDVYAAELIAKEPPVKVICIPSLNECAFNVTTPGLATEILETAADFVADID